MPVVIAMISVAIMVTVVIVAMVWAVVTYHGPVIARYDQTATEREGAYDQADGNERDGHESAHELLLPYGERKQ